MNAVVYFLMFAYHKPDAQAKERHGLLRFRVRLVDHRHIVSALHPQMYRCASGPDYSLSPTDFLALLFLPAAGNSGAVSFS
jgi:hypothetical protein